MPTLRFEQLPTIVVATNTFINIPIIIQYEDTPMLKLVKAADASYTTVIPIYNSDGIKLAVAIGTQLYPTQAGQRAKVTLRREANRTICFIGNTLAFELERENPAAMKMRAELFTNDGSFLKWDADDISGYVLNKSDTIRIARCIFRGCTFGNHRIAFHVKKDGSIAMGDSDDANYNAVPRTSVASY